MNETLFEFYQKLLDRGLTRDQIIQAFDEYAPISFEEFRTSMQPGDETFDKIVDESSMDTNELFAESFATNDAGMDGVVDRLRMIGQGALYGTADELEAGVRAALNPDTSYEAELEKVRSEISAFRESNPVESGAYELGGSFILPGFMLGKIAQIPGLALKVGQPFMNALRRVGVGALTGGIAGATYGLGSADPDPEMNLSDSISERLDVALDAGVSGAQFGGTVGASATKLLEVGAKAIGGRFGGGGKGPPPIDEQGSIPPGGTPSDAKFAQQARQSILRSMERDNVQIEDLEKSLDEMIQLGVQKNVTTAELLGAQGQGMAQVAARAPGVGPQMARDTFEDIGETSKRLARKNVFTMDPKSNTPIIRDYKEEGSRYFGQNVFQTEMTNMAKAKAQPFYDKADPIPFRDPALSQQINSAMKREDEVGAALKEAFRDTKSNIRIRQGDKQRKFPPYEVWGDEVGGSKPILHWHELMKAIDQRLDKFKIDSPALKTAAGQIRNFRDSIGNAIKGTKGEGGENFTKAQAIYSNKNAMVDAFKMGRQSHSSDIPATSVKSMMNQLKTPAEKKFFRLGFAFNLHKKISANNLKNPDMEKVISAYSLENQDKIRAVLGPNAERFMKKFNIIAKRGMLAGKLLTGSPTQPLQMIERDLKGTPALMQRAKEIYGRVRNPGQATTEISDLMQQKNLERQLEAMSPMMFNPGVQSTRRTIQDLAAEQNRLQRRMADPSNFVGRTPATVAPLLPQVSNQELLQNYFGLLGGF